MESHYNRLAGLSIDRLAALSDGIFAVAMTLLVLDLAKPALAVGVSERALWDALLGLAPQILTYLMSFITLGIFWHGQGAQLRHFTRSDRHLSWCNLAFLFAVSLVPFSTSLLALFIHRKIALLVYWGNIALLGGTLLGCWRYACRQGLVSEEVTPVVSRAIMQRIIRAQALYGLGALLCVFGTEWSLGFIVLVQLNYAFAPRLPGLRHLG